VRALVLSLVLVVAGCATGRDEADPTARERTISDQVLSFDASKHAGGDASCRSRKIVGTTTTRPFQSGSQPPAGQWTERWIVDRCGTQMAYDVHYLRAADGHLGVTIVRDPGAGREVVEGATLTDHMLQRDTVVLLTQKDLSETEGEACRTRRIINTELLNPVAGGQVEDGRPVAGQWVERWTLDRCGAPVRYIIHYTTTRAGTTFTADREK
jgi:hypothetical protein